MNVEEPALDVLTALRGHAAQYPDRIALSWLTGLDEIEESLTYGDLDVAAARIAGALRTRTVPGDRVLLVQPPGLTFVTGFFGSLYAGCVPVPVYPLLNTEEEIARIRRIVADSGAGLAWTSDEGMAAYVSQRTGLPALWEPCGEGWRADGPADPDALAFLQYTSGSTGRPRGVRVSHGNLAANLTAIRDAFEHDRDTTVLSWLPSYHDMGLIGNILHPLHTGCRAYLASPLDFISRPLSWLTAVHRHGVTTSGAPDFAYALVNKTLERQGPVGDGLDLSRWRTAYSGAEPVARATLERFAEHLAATGFRKEAFVPCYGLAEATLLVSSVPVGRGTSVRTAEDGTSGVSCGVPRGCDLAVVDASGSALPEGRIGEIAVSGAGVATGYWARDGRDPDVFGTTVTGEAGQDLGATWLRTGDLGFLADGELHVTGRAKDLIIVRGRNHYPQDLERLVCAHADVLRSGCAVAFASPDGEGVVVVAELRDGERLTDADRTRLAGAVASAHGVALTELVAVARGTVPKTTSGKIRRQECRTRFLAGAYDAARAGNGAAPAPGTDGGPRARVRRVVREVLGVDVPGDEPLVRHGLDSLRAVQIATGIARECGRDLSVGPILAGMTPDELVRAVASEPMRPLAAGGATECHGRLSRAQEALLFLHMLAPESDEYTIAFAWEPAGGTDLTALDGALRTALTRQPELAMRFETGADGTRRVPVAEEELRAALALEPRPVPDELMEERLAEAAATPFRPAKGPLLRCHRWQSPRRTVYQLVVHHLVTDLWSLAQIMRDVGELYSAEITGRPVLLTRTTPYDAYVEEQEAYSGSAAALERDAELRALMPTRSRPLDVRTDSPRSARRAVRGRRVTTKVPRTGIGAIPGKDRVALLTALWAATLHRYGTPVPVVVGVPVSGRTAGRHGGIGGLCTNTAPIAVDIDPEQPLTTLTEEVRRQLDRAMEAGMYPLARAVEVVGPTREPGRTPLVESMITVHENPLPGTPGLLAALAGHEAELVLGELALRTVPTPARSTRCDLDLVITPLDDGYHLALDHAADLFTARTARAVLDTFAAALAASTSATGGEDRCLGDVLVLSPADRELLGRVGRRDGDPLRPGVLERMRHLARERPDAPAVEGPDGVLTFAGFTDRVDRVAAALRAVTEKPGGRS
ncbi:AMP-binding protein [Streptomyces sp. NPDC002561]|uniref:AMP-binding protein n=1 Tax=Streptomyces sp. NPDC002561 TaxID=3154418 RepID=UPI003317B33B